MTSSMGRIELITDYGSGKQTCRLTVEIDLPPDRAEASAHYLHSGESERAHWELKRITPLESHAIIEGLLGLCHRGA